MATRTGNTKSTVIFLCFAAVLISYFDRTNISVAAIAMQEQFGWDEATKGLVLSSFFIGYLVLQVASGWLANRYGGRVVLGAAVVWWSLFTALTPPAASTSFAMLIAARVALGLGEAAVFPASINMIGRWVPPEDRSRATATFASGLAMGTVISLPLTAWIVRTWGWPMAFYAFGALGIVWGVAWFGLVPEGSGVAQAPGEGRKAVPWGKLLSTPAVWAIITSHFAHNWALYLMLSWLPSYFKAAFNMSLANAGLISAAPWFTSFIVANLGGILVQRLRASGLGMTTIRKRLIVGGFLAATAFLLVIPQAGTATVAVILMCCVTSSLAFTIAGFSPNCFDVAPRYADVIWGISNTAATVPGIVGVAVTGFIVQRTGSFSAAFLLTAAIAVVGAVTYLTMGSGEQQVD